MNNVAYRKNQRLSRIGKCGRVIPQLCSKNFYNNKKQTKQKSRCSLLGPVRPFAAGLTTFKKSTFPRKYDIKVAVRSLFCSFCIISTCKCCFYWRILRQRSYPIMVQQAGVARFHLASRDARTDSSGSQSHLKSAIPCAQLHKYLSSDWIRTRELYRLN